MTLIPTKTISRLLDSVAFMNSEYGVAFNAIITINFDQLGLSQARDAAGALTALNEALAAKFKRHAAKGFPVPHDGELFFLYAHENVGSHGRHLHNLVVLPETLRLDMKIWLQKWAHRRYGDAVNHRAIDLSARSRPKSLNQIAHTQAEIVRYVLKTSANAGVIDRSGNGANLHDLLGFKKLGPSRPFAVNRIAGTSENIARRAQLDAGYKPPEHWEDLLSVTNLHDYHSRMAALELTEQLRRIEV